jgi:hypothetical protein
MEIHQWSSSLGLDHQLRCAGWPFLDRFAGCPYAQTLEHFSVDRFVA